MERDARKLALHSRRFRVAMNENDHEDFKTEKGSP